MQQQPSWRIIGSGKLFSPLSVLTVTISMEVTFGSRLRQQVSLKFIPGRDPDSKQNFLNLFFLLWFTLCLKWQVAGRLSSTIQIERRRRIEFMISYFLTNLIPVGLFCCISDRGIYLLPKLIHKENTQRKHVRFVHQTEMTTSENEGHHHHRHHRGLLFPG